MTRFRKDPPGDPGHPGQDEEPRDVVRQPEFFREAQVDQRDGHDPVIERTCVVLDSTQ
jgi:hypothetical protein